MLGFIKWLIIFLVLGTILYIGDFFLNIDKDFLKQAKHETIEAIDSGETDTLVESVFAQIKQDLRNKREKAFIYIKDKLKGVLQ